MRKDFSAFNTELYALARKHTVCVAAAVTCTDAEGDSTGESVLLNIEASGHLEVLDSIKKLSHHAFEHMKDYAPEMYKLFLEASNGDADAVSRDFYGEPEPKPKGTPIHRTAWMKIR